MANPEHLNILKQGVATWNKWRKNNPSITPDLSGAILSNFSLNMADLGESNLNGSDLRFANLTGANLISATLNKSDITNANLSAANLWGTQLIDAILKNAKLYGTIFNDSNLLNTDFSKSSIGDTSFANVDLSVAKGLDRMFHFGSSSISIDTIYKSKRNIPNSFLKKSGVPDSFIKSIPSLIGKPDEYFSCFISHSHKDETFVKKLYNDLQEKGVRCWYYRQDMIAGSKKRDTIDRSIRKQDKLISVLSKNAIKSNWVEDEVETALELEEKKKTTVLIPIHIDAAVKRSRKAWVRKIWKSYQIDDFSNWKVKKQYQEAFDQLLKALKRQKEPKKKTK